MKFLVIQENGRHDKNRHFRECFCMQRSLVELGHECDVWGLGHNNYSLPIDFSSYDVIINLENYDTSGWVPSLANVDARKFIWSIDAHCNGIGVYQRQFHSSRYEKILQSTLQFVDDNSIWFPNAYDDTLINPLDIPKEHFIGFCGNTGNRGHLIDLLVDKFNLKKDIFVIGEDMVRAINSYKVHFNCNMSVDINYRSFETIGCGTALITNFNPAYEQLGFVDMQNCMLYATQDELLEKVEYLLKNEDVLNNITKNGLTLAKRHIYRERCKQLICYLQA